MNPIPFRLMQLGCSEYDNVNVSNTLEHMRLQDAILCSYAVEGGLTLPIFGAAVMLGVFNLPIYIKQESAAVPFVISLIVGGIVLTTVASALQAIAVSVILFGIGLGPILVLRRLDR